MAAVNSCWDKLCRVRKRLPTLKEIVLIERRQAVVRVKRHLRATPSCCALRGATLALSVLALCGPGGGLARAGEPGAAVEPGAAAEPGAADLLGDQPFQVGLMDQSVPSPPKTTSPIPGGAPQPPAQTPATPAPRQLVLDRRRKLLRVLEGEREVRRYPVAVGMPGWETPVGQFTVIEKRANPTWEHPASGQRLPPGPENPLGSRWIGFYRDCRGRSGFNGQEHLVVKGCVEAGFHGTPNRGSVGRAVSHGCVRLFDEHARELFDLVSLGTPVTVLP
jgi:L,D-transpeptidase ErfK/SrfK